MKNIFILSITIAMFSVCCSAQAEHWIHVQRIDEPVLNPADQGAFDTYLDTDFISVKDNWTFYRTKIVRDDEANEFHGKMELHTQAISCSDMKFSIKESILFGDVNGKQELARILKTKDELNRFSTNIRVLNRDALIVNFFLYACRGIAPDKWGDAKDKIFGTVN